MALSFRLSICLDPRFGFTFAFFFFLARVNSNIIWIHYTGDKVHCSRTVHRSHGTIHIFKNYFVTKFSIFSKISCIQTNPEKQVECWWAQLKGQEWNEVRVSVSVWTESRLRNIGAVASHVIIFIPPGGPHYSPAHHNFR